MASRQLLASNMTMTTMLRLTRGAVSTSRAFSTIRSRNLSTSLISSTQTTPRKSTTTFLPPLLPQSQRRSLQTPYKDSQDRNSLKPRKTEGTATGSDDEVAAMPEAWDTTHTRPEDELEEGRREGSSGWSMLDESGGNQEFSKPQGDSLSENRGAEKSGKKNKSGEAKSKKHGLLKPKA